MAPYSMVFTGGPISDAPATATKPTRQSKTASNTRPALLLEDPQAGPFQRMRDEWKDNGSWFNTDDCGRLLDVPSSFGGTQTIYKWLLTLWMMASLLYCWTTSDYGGAWFLGDLDHWALLISMIYQILSLANGHFTPPQTGVPNEAVNHYLKFFWIVFEIAAHLQLLVTILFWVIIFPTSDGYTIDYSTFVLHGLVLVAVWVDGMVLNRIPVRIKHYFFVLFVDMIYCLWTIIHAAADMGNGKSTTRNTETGEIPSSSDAIYLALDWQDETVQTVFLMVFILAVLAPLLFLFQYLLSLYGFPWSWNGSKSRKCINLGGNADKTSRTSSSPDQFGTTTTTGRPTSPVFRATSPPRVRPSSPTKRSSSRPTSPFRATSPPAVRPSSPTKRSSSRPTSPAPRRPTSPTPRRASTGTPRATTPTPKRKSSTPKKSQNNKNEKKHSKRTKERNGRPKPKRERSHMDIA